MSSLLAGGGALPLPHRRPWGAAISLLPLALLVSAGCAGAPAARPAPPAEAATSGLEGALAGWTLPAAQDGTPLEIARPGQVTLVDLWATWCSPCVRSLPAWQALYDERLQSEGLAFVAISFDDEREDAARFVRERGLTFPIAWDPVGEATARRHRDGSLLPTTLIVDCAGTIRHVHEGYHGPESLDRLADHAAALQGEPSCQEP